MALIKCEECGKEISSRASACPNCGCPVSIQTVQVNQFDNENGKDLVCPEFPKDLDLGKPSIFFATKIPSESIDGIITMMMSHQNGLKVIKNGKVFQLIHKSQIISIEELTKQDIQLNNKSVIGRAIVGGILFAGVGAIVGGISALNNQKLVNNYCLIINYWDIETKKPVSFILNTKDSNSRFISKFKENVLIR